MRRSGWLMVVPATTGAAAGRLVRVAAVTRGRTFRSWPPPMFRPGDPRRGVEARSHGASDRKVPGAARIGLVAADRGDEADRRSRGGHVPLRAADRAVPRGRAALRLSTLADRGRDRRRGRARDLGARAALRAADLLPVPAGANLTSVTPPTATSRTLHWR